MVKLQIRKLEQSTKQNMLKSKFLIRFCFCYALLSIIISCHNGNKKAQNNLVAHNSLNIQNNLAHKDSIIIQDSLDIYGIIDSITPPQNINKYEVLLDTSLVNTRIKVLYTRPMGNVYLVFKGLRYKKVFSVILFEGIPLSSGSPYPFVHEVKKNE
jgi:hypothetical protein